MSQMSDYLENILTDHLFRTRTFTKPTTIAIALYTVTPADAGGGTECSGTGYARASFTPADAAWNGTQGNTTGNSSGTTGASSNAVAINFPTPGAGGWGTVVAWAAFDATTSGNMLIWAPLSISKTINQNDGVSFAAGQLTVTAA